MTSRTNYQSPDEEDFRRARRRGSHPEAERLVKALMELKGSGVAGEGLNHDDYDTLRDHLSVVLHARDEALHNKYGLLFDNLKATASMLSTGLLDSTLSKIVSCIELLPDDKVKMVLGSADAYKSDDERDTDDS